MWTDVFAAPGWRTTGTQAGDFLVVPPGWRPDFREKFVEKFKLPKGTQLIEAPTPNVWIIGRTKTDGPEDYGAVHKIQSGFKITPLIRWGKKPEPVAVKIDKAIDMKTPPKLQVGTKPAGRFFAMAAELLKKQPPHITDQPIIARLRRIGFDAGKSFDLDKLDPSIRGALATVPAIVTQLGLGANLPEDAIYPLNLTDETGKPLDGAHNYVLHFDKGKTPPVDAFWSITLYGPEGFQVATLLCRGLILLYL